MAHDSQRTRTTYHHGDLRAALVEAGTELARKGGPEAIVLREVTRIVGVAPNSVYGHFTTLFALRQAVSQHALGEMAAAMLAHLAAVEEPTDPQEAAKTHLREVGRAYVHFALDEPGLFKTAMDGNPAGVSTPGSPDGKQEPGQGDRPKPDSVLLDALARLAETGCLAPEAIGDAVMASWATVHGLAGILLDLQPSRSDTERDDAINAGLHILIRGLTT